MEKASRGEMKLTTIDLTPRIGTEIKADLETLLSGSAAAEFREVPEERGVIVFREFHLDDRQQVAFAKTLGELDQVGRGKVFSRLHSTARRTAALANTWLLNIWRGQPDDLCRTASLSALSGEDPSPGLAAPIRPQIVWCWV
jgi:Taurine catabolism dioxygenase TauD, TfdA family